MLLNINGIFHNFYEYSKKNFSHLERKRLIVLLEKFGLL